MMATPMDLEAFGVGFSLTEGIVAAPGEIAEIEVVDHGAGVEIRMWLAPGAAGRLAGRRRRMAGPVGCGLCGVDSIEAALAPAATVERRALRLTPADATGAIAALRARQPLHDATGAAHAAGLWRPGAGLLRAFEDVGRHNALDKLAGATALAAEDAAGAAVILTSRISVEMVQKAAAMGAEAVVAVSAPTALAVRMADAAGLTLIANVRDGAARALAHPARLQEEPTG
jgi:FdhD protein